MRTRRWWSIGGVLLVAAAVFTAWGFAENSYERDDVARATAAVRIHTADLDRQLRAARADRDAANGLLARARIQLASAQQARGVSTSRLRSTQQLLASVRGATYSSVVRANARREQLAALGTCLDGVSAALNELSVGDGAGWQQTMSAVATPCRIAVREIPA